MIYVDLLCKSSYRTSRCFPSAKEDEPYTLYYHLAKPNIEAEARIQVDVLLYRTAVSQTLTLLLNGTRLEAS